MLKTSVQPPRRDFTRRLVSTIGLEVGVAGVRSKGLLELALLDVVEGRAGHVDNEELGAAVEGGEGVAEGSLAGVAEGLEQVGGLLHKELVLEAGERVGIEESSRVVGAIGQIANVEPSKRVVLASVATDIEELWVLDCHAYYILQEEGNLE